MAPDPLTELVDEGRAAEGVAVRGRERAMRQMAEEEARLAGALIDLVERASTVAVRTETGRTYHGVLLAVGTDYCALRTAGGAEPHLRLSAIATVRPHPGERHVPATGDRPPPVDLLLLEVLARAVAHSTRVTLFTRGGDTVVGRLLAVGADVVTVRPEAGGREPCYVAGPAITEALVEG